jgi:hypothetical protein
VSVGVVLTDAAKKCSTSHKVIPDEEEAQDYEELNQNRYDILKVLFNNE